MPTSLPPGCSFSRPGNTSEAANHSGMWVTAVVLCKGRPVTSWTLVSSPVTCMTISYCLIPLCLLFMWVLGANVWGCWAAIEKKAIDGLVWKKSFNSVHQASVWVVHACSCKTNRNQTFGIWWKQRLIEDPASSYRLILFFILLLDTLINLPACWDQSASAAAFTQLRLAIHLMAARRTQCNWI